MERWHLTVDVRGDVLTPLVFHNPKTTLSRRGKACAYQGLDALNVGDRYAAKGWQVSGRRAGGAVFRPVFGCAFLIFQVSFHSFSSTSVIRIRF